MDELVHVLRNRLRAASRKNLPPGLENVPEPVARHFANLSGYEIAVFLRRLVPRRTRTLIVGVGAGRDWWYLGLDNEVVALDVAEQSTVPNVVLADFSRDIPFPDEYFGAVVISDVLEHVIDDLAALRNCRRVLRGDGVLVLNLPYGDDIGDHHVRVYTRATIRRLLAAVGFSVVNEVERGPLAHLDRYRMWRAMFHGYHFLRLVLFADPGYDRTLRRLAQIDWFFGSRRIVPTRLSKRHGAYLTAVKAPPRDFIQLNREFYTEQGSRQIRSGRASEQ
jgi:SAM-dependent methyltransferase